MQKKPRIAILGRTNAGKSTLMNLISGQATAIVSPQAGTTTDPVRRPMHLTNYGSVVWIDTAGFDDQTILGTERRRKTLLAAAEADAALFVAASDELDEGEKAFIRMYLEGEKPFIVLHKPFPTDIFDQIRTLMPPCEAPESDFFGGRVAEGDVVVLVCPIDAAAPMGKLIMPQMAALRAALDLHATAIVVQPDQLAFAFEKRTPRLVVTDSQVFDTVRAIVPQEVELTSFSILLAESSGCFDTYVKGAQQIGHLQSGDRVLLVEHCTHETTCQDIARVKIPQLLGGQIETTVVRGNEALEQDFAQYTLVVQCGGCVASNALVAAITNRALGQGAVVTNFGLLLKKLLA